MVISESANDEALRFASQSLKIDPTQFSESLLEKSSRIDGASLVDSDGICHAIGVILDGPALSKGKKERGARYNSAVRYVQSQSTPCVALVISDDGMIDVVPEYKSAMSRRMLQSKIDELRSLQTSEQIETKTFNDLLAWFEVNREFLKAEHTDQLNALFPVLEANVRGGGFRSVYAKMEPNGDLEDYYYTD